MEDPQEDRQIELIEKNRQIVNQRLLEEIRKTGSLIYGLFYDSIKSSKIHDTNLFLEQLKRDGAKATRIKWREDRQKQLNNVQKITLKLLEQFFNKKFIKIAGEPQIGGLYFNQGLKELMWFDFIFGYQEFGLLGHEDVKTYVAKFFLDGGEKQFQKKSETKEKSKPTKKIRLAKGHKLVNLDNYHNNKQELLELALSSTQKYANYFDIDIQNKQQYKQFIQSYFIYILKDIILQTKRVFDIKNLKNCEALRVFIQDLIDYFQDILGENIDIDIKMIIIKFFRNTNTNEIFPLDLVYANTTIQDIKERINYFDQTYFSPHNTSSKKIYIQIMKEFHAQGNLVKASHAFLSPDYFILKEKKEELDSDLYVLNNYNSQNIEIQNLISSKRQQLLDIMTKLDNHFYSKIEKDKERGKGDSIEKITQKYMKYHQIPIQYRRNFFIVINYLNHYHNIKSSVNKKAQEHNWKIEKQILSAPDQQLAIINFVNQIICQEEIKDKIQSKLDQYYQKKLNKIKQSFSKNQPQNKYNQEGKQLTIDF